MASIIKRKNSFAVVYKVEGKQIWETFKTEVEAEARKLEVEYTQSKGTFVAPNPMLLEDFLTEYIEVYGKTKWSHSSYNNNVSLIKNYINPNIGDWRLKDISTKKMDAFFTRLKTQEAVQRPGRPKPGLISDRNIYEINLLLSNAFDRAVEWEYVGKNPITRNACPERKDKKRVIWEPETALHALSICQDLTLLACMHLALDGAMRIGEVTGLRWQHLSFGNIESGFSNPTILIESQMQRISKETYDLLDRKQNQVKFVFPAQKEDLKSMLVLKTLKTDASRRVVYLTSTTASLLWRLREEQNQLKASLGEEYQDFDLVIAQRNGRPIEGGHLDKLFARFIKDNGLPAVEFHSLRHLSATVKLSISGGDIKSVQGDTGHQQAKMVTDQYGHILEKNRMKNAKKFDEEFYGGQKSGEQNGAEVLKQVITYCLQDPAAFEKFKALILAN